MLTFINYDTIKVKQKKNKKRRKRSKSICFATYLFICFYLDFAMLQSFSVCITNVMMYSQVFQKKIQFPNLKMASSNKEKK